MTCVNLVDPFGSGHGGGEPQQMGGGTGPVVHGGSSGGNAREAARKERCKKCRQNAQDCLNRSLLAGQTCANNARRMASSFCREDDVAPSQGVTAWGCEIQDLQKQQCLQAEAPWNDTSKWEFECKTQNGKFSCGGPAMSSCLDSWRLSHPKGVSGMGASGELSAEIEGVGGKAGATFSEQYTWDGRTGYGSVCTTVASNLSHKCTGWQNICQGLNHCTAADFD